MKIFLTSILVLWGLSLVGCMPVERFWWSPGGDRAVVVLDQEAHLVDETGAIQRRIPLGSEAAKTWIDDVDWFAEGERFAAHRIRVFEEWTDARECLPPDEAERIEEVAAGMPEILTAAVLVGGDAERPSALLDRIPGADSDLLRSAFFLSLETRPAEIERALANAPRCRAALKEDRDEVDRYLVHEIVIVDLSGEEGGEAEIILATSELIRSPTLSPPGTAIAFSRKQEDKNLYSIEMIPLGSGLPVTVVKGAHESVSWTDDGRAVVFVAPAANEGILKQIKRVTVFGGSGELLDPKNRQTMNLAAAVIPFAPRIEKLPGNKILFASQDVRFPVANAEVHYEAHLYQVSADDGSLEQIATSPGALPMNLGFFVASPDGKRVAVVESDTDAVAVVDVETGRTELVSPAHENWRCRTLPAWKSNEELTFAALDEATGATRWRLWRNDEETQILSRDWPVDATDDWLEKKEDP